MILFPADAKLTARFAVAVTDAGHALRGSPFQPEAAGAPAPVQRRRATPVDSERPPEQSEGRQ